MNRAPSLECGRRALRPLALAALCGAALALGAVSAAAQTVPVRYLAFGDSITAGVGDDPARVNPGYPFRLQQLLATVGVTATVQNHGLPGERTMEGLTRIDTVLATAVTGDVLLLMEGTNDISRDLGVESAILNLDEMARKAEVKGLAAVHATLFPRRPDAKVDALNVVNDQMNGLIRNLAGIRVRRLVDPYQVFGAIPNSFPSLFYQGGDDPVGHPNAAGYDVLARTFAEALRNIDTVPPVPGALSPASGSTNVRADAPINVDVWDFGAGIDLANTFLLVNNAVVTVTPTGSPQRANLRYVPPAPLTGIVTVGLRSRDLANPANSTDKTIARFSIQAPVLEGDVNLDGRVDGGDLILFALGFGATRGTGNYTEAADLNHDGTINGQDLAILATNFGRLATTTTSP